MNADELEAAACRQIPASRRWIFHVQAGPVETLAVAEAKAVCAGCPVRSACLSHAVAHGEHGIWGGTSDHDRQTAA